MSPGADALDSNGSAIITGGTTLVATAAQGGGDGSIDVNGALAVNGGTLVALGGISGSPAADSQQGFLATSLDTTVAEGQQIAAVNADGEVVWDYTTTAATSAIIVADDSIVTGESYDIEADDTTVATATAGESTGSEMGGGMRGGPGDHPDRQGGDRFGAPPDSTDQG